MPQKSNRDFLTIDHMSTNFFKTKTSCESIGSLRTFGDHTKVVQKMTFFFWSDTEKKKKIGFENPKKIGIFDDCSLKEKRELQKIT